MLNSLKISLVLLPLALLLVVGVYVYSLWVAERQRAADLPVDAAEVITRDLLSFNRKRGGFPKDLREMEGVVWNPKEGRSYSNANRAIAHRNYFYLYSRQSHHRSTLWAMPLGPRRDEASAWFLVVTPGSQRRWKGGALRLEDVREITSDPTSNQLAAVGLIEQPDSPNKKVRN